ncbi:MAG: HlyD family efflux transporter periplasmic adaptor subunit [Methylovulum sp.]|jgi:hypothetical protein|nr:HlyD family efflux transporter periplasmic adaptor subunit [Methylovulum sp.]MCF7998363.1 HlyD family efflux transporter periplasmic adaptor subunit [Methylovulum sp.]
MSEQRHQQLLKLTLLLQLEQRARTASFDELPYILVNETAELLPYRQAVLWDSQAEQIKAVSGVPQPEKNAPYTLWITEALKHFAKNPRATDTTLFNAPDLSDELAADWGEWLPEHGLWLPLPSPSGSSFVLLLFRESVWFEAELHILTYLCSAYGHALALSTANVPQRTWHLPLKGKRLQRYIAALVVLVLVLPVRQSVLADAEVIPHHPHLVRAPLDGVIETFYIQPNESVSIGQKLFALDMTQLRSRLNVAQETLDIAKTEYLQTTQQAMLDPAAKAKLATLKSKWDQQVAEAEYLQTLLKRCEVTASKAGVAVFDDPNDWLGHPVTQGEKILAVANPQTVELEVRLPMEDLIYLEEGSEVLFFPNVEPHHPMPAALSYFSYRASPTPANVMAYRLKAQFTDSEKLPRLGYRGVAKLYGSHRPLLLWLLRKPIRTVRTWLAW